MQIVSSERRQTINLIWSDLKFAASSDSCRNIYMSRHTFSDGKIVRKRYVVENQVPGGRVLMQLLARSRNRSDRPRMAGAAVTPQQLHFETHLLVMLSEHLSHRSSQHVVLFEATGPYKRSRL